MPTAELVLRIVTFTQLSVLVAFLWRSAGENRSYRYTGLLLLGVSCYMLAPLVLIHWDWGPAGYPIVLLAIVVPVLFWYFTRAVFSDTPDLHWSIKWLALATAALGLLSLYTSKGSAPASMKGLVGPLSLASQLSKFVWLGAAVVAMVQDWQADLVESRRRLRRLIVIASGCYIGIVLIVEMFLDGTTPAALELFNVGALTLVASALCWHFLSLRETNVLATMAMPVALAPPAHSALAQQVLVLMKEERAFASDPLSISTLAARLRTQPYQLRQVINGELGYRNFNAFINEYRVREVAKRLSQDEFRTTPLLTLALDAGFRSLAPFNRSFKDHYNVTPSDYRQNLEK